MSSSTSPLTTGSDRSPNSPVSPKTLPSPDGYFSPGRPRLESITEHVKAEHTQRPRASSTASVSFRSAPEKSQSPRIGQTKAQPKARLREVSPEPPSSRFQHHVSFDNFAGGEPTEKNIISFTLNVSHRGYQRKRRSRTFMVGIDENDYSDIALRWMLDELVDDGDQVICLRVVSQDHKIASDKNVERREYQKAANVLMDRIQSRNDENRSISITLEFAVGKIHPTFQSIIQMYEPAMLVVGTRGRSLGGIQGLISNHNSFSKWCLQYSPIPVVVVRPTEKRLRKKDKRAADPTRQDYHRILKDSGLTQHETAHGTKSDGLEITNNADAEAHAVAAALGLPARFDPTIKPISEAFDHTLKPYPVEDKPLQTVNSEKSDAVSLSPDSRPVSPAPVLKSPKPEQLESPAMSGDEAEDSDEDDEDEGEFEAVPGHLLLGNDREEEVQKQKLHAMEQDEAGALLLGRKSSIGSADSSGSGGGGGAPIDEDEDEEEDGGEDTPMPA